MKTSVLVQPETITAPKPAFADGGAGVAAERARATNSSAAPKYQVIRFQAIAPSQPGKNHGIGDDRQVDHALADRRRDGRADTKAAAAKLKNAAHSTA